MKTIATETGLSLRKYCGCRCSYAVALHGTETTGVIVDRSQSIFNQLLIYKGSLGA